MHYKREKLGVKDDREGLHSTRLLVQKALRIAQASAVPRS
jgi:hypothetical protein